MRPTVLMDEIRIEREGIVLGWAPLVSIALHLVAIAMILGFVELRPRRPSPPREPPIQITFQPPATLRMPSGGGGATPGSAGGGSARPIPRSMERGNAAPRPAPALPPSPERQVREDREAATAPARPRADDRPLADSSPARETTEARSPDRPSSQGFSMQRALRDFRKSLDAGSPGGPAGSGGTGDSPGSGLNVPDLPPLPDSGFGFGNLQFESRDFDWTDYARQIYVAIWRAWHNRLYLTTDAFEKWGYENHSSLLDHQSRIRFTIERNGQVTGVSVEASSLCAPLDDSAVRALEEVVLPPLPAAFPRDQETIHARFIAQGDLRGMRSTLSYLRAHGFF